MFIYYLLAFVISMIPLIELRGAIPVVFGLVQNALGVEVLPAQYIVSIFAVCIVGNMLPVPFIYWFARKFLEWGAQWKWSWLRKFCNFFLEKGGKAGEKLQSKTGWGIFVALMLFVGIPLPGTGAWTGTLAASLLDMKFKDTIIAVILGVLIAGLIMMAGSFGVFSAIFAIAR